MLLGLASTLARPPRHVSLKEVGLDTVFSVRSKNPVDRTTYTPVGVMAVSDPITRHAVNKPLVGSLAKSTFAQRNFVSLTLRCLLVVSNDN